MSRRAVVLVIASDRLIMPLNAWMLRNEAARRVILPVKASVCVFVSFCGGCRQPLLRNLQFYGCCLLVQSGGIGFGCSSSLLRRAGFSTVLRFCCFKGGYFCCCARFCCSSRLCGGGGHEACFSSGAAASVLSCFVETDAFCARFTYFEKLALNWSVSVSVSLIVAIVCPLYFWAFFRDLISRSTNSAIKRRSRYGSAAYLLGGHPRLTKQ